MRTLPSEDRRVALDVVVGLLLARDLADLDLDRHRRADLRGLRERDRYLGVRARLRLVDALACAEALAVALDPDGDVHVGLVVLALVLERDRERDVRAGGDAVGGLPGLEGHVA